MTALSDFMLQNSWISYIAIFVWIIATIFILKIDIGILRGRGDFKDKKGKFENQGITFLKIIPLGIISILSIIFSSPIILVFKNLGLIILGIMAIITIFISIPVQTMEKGPAADLGLRWIIRLIDKHDSRKKK